MVECEGRGQGEAGAGLGLGEHDEPGGGELVLQAAEPDQGGESESVALHRDIGVAGSFSEGGQPFRPAKIQSLPAKIFSCLGGPSLPILFCHAKLLCQTVLPMDNHCR